MYSLNYDVYIPAVHTLYSNSSYNQKVKKIQECTDYNAPVKEIQKLLQKKINADVLIKFMVRWCHPFELPLHIKNHIRHLNNNLILKECIHDPEISIVIQNEHKYLSYLPPELSYVLKRIPYDKDLTLSSNWTIESRSRSDMIVQDYIKFALETIFKTLDIDCTMILRCAYMGMGHYAVLAFDASTMTFFKFLKVVQMVMNNTIV